jgi:hypothetical protein
MLAIVSLRSSPPILSRHIQTAETTRYGFHPLLTTRSSQIQQREVIWHRVLIRDAGGPTTISSATSWHDKADKVLLLSMMPPNACDAT